MPFPDRSASGDARIKLVSSGSATNPKKDDVLSVVLGQNIESAGVNFLINRGAGFVTLAIGVDNYQLKDADIPPVGTAQWPIIARALDLTLVSPPFYSRNPA